MNIIEIIKGRLNRVRLAANTNRGFTLIEIMIVVAIIAILMGVVIVPNIMRYPKKARVEAAKIQIKGFQLPLNEYMTTHGNYPSTQEGLEALVTEKILTKKDITDPWGNPYQYRYPGESDPDNYDVWSYGADGKDGGEGFNADIKSWDEK
jgi:general secretion pathway protein G